MKRIWLIAGLLVIAAVAAAMAGLVWKRQAGAPLGNTGPNADVALESDPVALHDWPSFRGDAQLTGVTTSSLPSKLTRRWKYQAEGGIESTAAIFGDRVYVGTMARAESGTTEWKPGSLVVLNLADGSKLWEFPVSDSIAASPCVAGGRVFVGDTKGIFYAIDIASHQQAWTFKTGDKIMSSAIVEGGDVLVGSYDYRLLCLDAASGECKWSVTTDAQVHCSPGLCPQGAVIAGCDGRLRVLDLQNGEQRLGVSMDGPSAASPAMRDGHVYLGTLKGDCMSIRLSDGTREWMLDGEDPAQPISQITASAAVTEDAVFIASNDFRLLKIGRIDGKIKWTFSTRDVIESSPVIVGRRVFFGSNDGDIYGLDVETGKVLWRFTAGGEVKASPAIGGGCMVIGNSNGTLYCFGAPAQAAAGPAPR